MRKLTLVPALLLVLACSAFAQDKTQDTVTTPSVAAATTTTEGIAPTAPVPADPFLAMRIPANSKIYIAPFKSEDAAKPVEGAVIVVERIDRK